MVGFYSEERNSFYSEERNINNSCFLKVAADGDFLFVI
jgi:hypothetical protein